MAVIAPIQATTPKAAGLAAEKSGKVRATIYTPAATMVAAWMSALTGVGPSMAGGNQTCSGTCADFPTAPQKTRIIASVNRPWLPANTCATPVGSLGEASV